MSFQAYIDNIKIKTGKSPDDFLKEAKSAGMLDKNKKPTEVINWIKSEYGLGLGHARAIYEIFKQKGFNK